MESAASNIPATMQFEVNTLGPLDDYVPQNAANIRREDAKLIVQLVQAIDRPLLNVLACRTREEIVETRKRVWDTYFRARRSFGDTLTRLLSKAELELVSLKSAESISEDLARFRGNLFSEEIAQQFEFAAWLVSRIQGVGHKIAKLGLPQDRDADVRLNADFNLHTAWGQFHYDCVLASMKFEQPIPDGIEESIRDGLRAWVNASAIVEEALSLRTGDSVGGVVEFIKGAPWDNEDQELLDASMKDMEKHLSNDV